MEGGKRVVLGTLTMGSCDQFSTDLMVGGGDAVTISHTSKKATVHITGYMQEDIFSEDDESFEGAEDYDADDNVPEELKMKIGKELQAMAMAGIPFGEVKEVDSEEEEEEEEEDSDFDLEDEDAMGSEDSESEEEGDDGEDSSSSEEELAAGKKEVPGTAALARGIIADDDESDSDSDSSSSSSDDDGKELMKLKGRKRVVPDTKSSEGTPTESKKRSKTSPSTPASTSSTPGKTPVLGDAKSYEADLVNFLRVNGETTMAIIGTRVKKPSGVPKLGQFIETRAGVFKRSGDKIDLA